MARPRLLRRLHGRPGVADRRWRRRRPDLRDIPSPSRQRRARRRVRSARARPRWRRDADPCRSRLRPLLARTVPLLRLLRVERPVRAVYEGIHSYRGDAALLVGVFALTVAVQSVRVLAIWMAGKAVGVGLSPRPYYVMGPLLFLVLLVPFTINGLAVREAFFVSFL